MNLKEKLQEVLRAEFAKADVVLKMGQESEIVHKRAMFYCSVLDKIEKILEEE